MSEINVAVVCEGETDFEILEAILASVWPSIDPAGEHVMTLIKLQPEGDGSSGNAGAHGGGWRGVCNWCRTARDFGGLAGLISLRQFKVLIILVDGEVAEESSVACNQPCPPASASIDALRAFILQNWLNEAPPLPPELVFCIPAQETELWVWSALFPEEVAAQRHPECLRKPSNRLNRRELCTRIPKTIAAYRNIKPRVADAWPQVVQMIPEAGRFDLALRQALVRP